MNAGGQIVVAWQRQLRNRAAIEVRTGRSPGRLGRTRRLAVAGTDPRVAHRAGRHRGDHLARVRAARIPLAPVDAETVARRIPAISLVAAGPRRSWPPPARRGPVRVRTVGAGGLGPALVLARRGNGDVTLVAAGSRVVAVFQVADRVRLTVVR